MLEHLGHSHQHPQPSGSLEHMSKIYDHFTRLLFMGKERHMRESMVKMAGIRPGSRVLDAGCGTGTLTLLAKRAAGASGVVTGLDVAPGMIEIARQKAKDAGLEIDFQTGMMEALPFETGQFDVALTSLALHHLDGEEARRKGLAELRRVLKPGGTLLIAEFQPPTRGFWKWFFGAALGGTMMRINLENLERLAEENGFRVERVPSKVSFIVFLQGRA